MRLYLYCVSETGEFLEPSLEGISSGRLSWIDIDELHVLTSEFEGEFVPVSRENVLKHAAVIAGLLTRTSPLPFRFGTLATADHLKSFVTARSSALHTRLSFVRDCLEMSVKIIWVKSADVNANPEITTEKNEGVGVGTAFLTKKRRELEGGQAESKRAEELSAWLTSKIGHLVNDEVVNLRPGEKLVFSAAHLVWRESLLEYREIMTNVAKERPDLRFLVSGPWAPYSFANIELEFKSHFGVI